MSAGYAGYVFAHYGTMHDLGDLHWLRQNWFTNNWTGNMAKILASTTCRQKKVASIGKGTENQTLGEKHFSTASYDIQWTTR